MRAPRCADWGSRSEWVPGSGIRCAVRDRAGGAGGRSGNRARARAVHPPVRDGDAGVLCGRKTFDAIVGRSDAPFWGGGVNLVVLQHYYVEVSASRLLKKNAVLTGHRAAVVNGQAYDLGIPLTASIVPLEVEGGYRFTFWPRVVPYVGAGFGSYAYTETCQDDAARPICAQPWPIRETPPTSTRVTGGWCSWAAPRSVCIGGSASPRMSISRACPGSSAPAACRGNSETNLGGVSARVKVLVGR